MSQPFDRLHPTGASERIERLDVLRGFSLFGVLAANLILASRIAVTPQVLEGLATATIDPIADALYVFFVRGKAYNLFAFLFGLGFTLQVTRAEARGVAHTSVFARRMLWLFVFGTAHAVLLWWGDILHYYAVGGLLLLASRRLSSRTLLVLGLLLSLGYRVGFWAYYKLLPPSSSVMATWMSQADSRLEVLQGGGYFDVLVVNLDLLRVLFLPESIVGLLASVLGLFLLGCWVGRGRWLQAETVERRPFLRVLAVGLAVGVPLNALVAAVKVFNWGGLKGSLWYTLSESAGVPALAAAYLALIVLLFDRPGWRVRLGWLAPVGRMALTHYLVHSCFFFVLLYGAGPGLGLSGRIGPALALLIAIAIFAFQVAVSQVWLARFRFGPAEWLWRALTYGERPAFRRAAESQAGRSVHRVHSPSMPSIS